MTEDLISVRTGTQAQPGLADDSSWMKKSIRLLTIGLIAMMLAS